MASGKILIGIVLLLLAFFSIKQANPLIPDTGAFLLSLLISAALYEWVSRKLHVK